ncbi:MAG: fructose-1,6-bisphosphatase [Clostridiales bacterium]|nr:fructose-1,6-bisphosphatase [Clostridiales bacterium]
MNITHERLKYLRLLADSYPNINSASTEIINLKAILNLPKGTEHFLSDIHGEYASFNHILRNASGVIKNYINELFGENLMENEKSYLATLIYYPESKLDFLLRNGQLSDEWYKVTLFRLVKICKRVSTKYTRSKVRKALPQDFAYIIEELLHEDGEHIHKHNYYHEIIESIIELGRADAFIIAICNLIQRLAIDHLHVVGDIFDRGPEPFKVMETLMNYHSCDIQWGNHDIAWMGAAAGSQALICNVIRIAAKYNELDTIEDQYSINLVPLAAFAMATYKDTEIGVFKPSKPSGNVSERAMELAARIHKAITIMQFKLEAAVIKRRPEYDMSGRMLLHRVNPEEKTINIDGKTYRMIDTDFPTVDWNNPYELSTEEQEIINQLTKSFTRSLKLQEHMRFLFNKGCMYNTYNNSLLFHGSIPVLKDGTFKEVSYLGGNLKYSGKRLMDETENTVRRGYFSTDDSTTCKHGVDLMWYLWCGKESPLFGKNRMATFERYFIEEEEAGVESNDNYYKFREDPLFCDMILRDFGLDPENSRIINGHMPVKVARGENPIKAEGKLIVIDGGFSRAYQKVTGIAGYTLIYNSQGLMLAAHEPFRSMEEAVVNDMDIITNTMYIERYPERKKVQGTDVGVGLAERIEDLKELVRCFRDAVIKQR